jgi:nucleoside-diphosphate-sugar epimerase
MRQYDARQWETDSIYNSHHSEREQGTPVPVNNVASPINVLVTGAGGFLGRHVAQLHCQRGDHVRSFSRSRYNFLDELGVEQVQGDLRDAPQVAASCRGIDVVQHIAGIAGIWGRWKDYHGINVLGTGHVIEGCRAHGVGRLVYTSSPSVTFDGRDQLGIDESAPYPRRWSCHYPRSKAMAEELVLNTSDHQLATCALRPHLIWGPHDNHLLPRLLARSARGRLRRIGNGKNRIDMVYVENAALAQLQAADSLSVGSPLCGRAYWITQGEPVNCWDWIDRLIACAGLPAVKKSIPAHLAWLLGGCLEALYKVLPLSGEPPMTRFLARQLSTSHYFQIDRARNDFDYSPAVSTEQGLERLTKYLDRRDPEANDD